MQNGFSALFAKGDSQVKSNVKKAIFSTPGGAKKPGIPP